MLIILIKGFEKFFPKKQDSSKFKENEGNDKMTTTVSLLYSTVHVKIVSDIHIPWHTYIYGGLIQEGASEKEMMSNFHSSVP